MLQTGFYGVPGTRLHTKVHVINGGKPLCGWTPRKEQEFQWCARRIWWEVIECGSCKRMARRLMDKMRTNNGT